MNDLIRSSDLTGTMQQLKVLNEKIIKLTAVQNLWQLNCTSEVIKEGSEFHVKFIFTKPNGQGFTKTLTAENIAYYVEDPEALSQELSQDIFDKFYKQQVRDTIAAVVTNSLRNAKMMQDKS